VADTYKTEEVKSCDGSCPPKEEQPAPMCALVIGWDGEFVNFGCCVGEGKNDLKYPDEFQRNLNDLTTAECFDSIEDAIAFCKKNCPPGVQVLANPCTRAEEILYEHE